MENILIRPSGVNNFFDCSYRWYRDTIYKPIRRVGLAAHFGTSLHKAGEVYYSECIKDNEWKKYNSAYEDLVVETLREKCKEDTPEDFVSIAQLNPLEKKLMDTSKSYITNARLLNNEKLPIAVEKTYKIEAKSMPITVQGTLDIVGEDYIIDIKTMNKLNNPTKYIVQQGIYAYLRSKNNEKVNNLIIHRVLSKDKEYIDSQSILDHTLFTMDNIIEKSKFYLEVIAKTCNNFLKTGDESLFRGNPTSMLCSSKYCAYFEECKFRKL